MFRKIFLLLFVMMFVGSCKKESPFAALSGTVYYEGIAIPVGDVRLKVDQIISYSGSDGSYDLAGIRKGVYVLRADKEGFEPFRIEMEFLKDKIYQNIQMVSEIFTSSIYGNIYGDYSEEPRIGLRCVIMNPNGSASRLEAYTDTSGFYEISRVPRGSHTIKVIEDREAIYQERIDVGAEDINFDIVFSDVFKFEDERDGREYSALKIGNLSWMIENMAYLPYHDDPINVSSNENRRYVYEYQGEYTEDAKGADNYKKYGVLYNWKAAVNACPEGWHLPTDDDWKNLEKFLGMDEFEAEMDNWRDSGEVGEKLKDSLGWAVGGEGDNSSWFNALPGGYIGYNGGSSGAGFTASFWTSSKCREGFAYYRSLSNDQIGMLRLCNSTRYGYSVRCVR